MSGEELDCLSGWLDLTERELDLVKIIYRIEVRAGSVSPEDIAREIKRLKGKKPLKPNLFHMLKKLRQQNIISRSGYGRYQLNREGIQKNLETRGLEFQRELEQFQKVQSDVEGTLQKLAWRLTQPKVEYLNHNKLYQAMSKTLRDAQRFQVVTGFPNISLSRQIVTGLHREEYNEALYRRAVKTKKMELEYLTDLNIDHLFNLCFRMFGEPKHAYREAQATIDRLETLINQNPNIHVRYHEDPHGLDVAVKTTDQPQEFILFIKDEHEAIEGGLRISSRETSRNAHQMFLRGYQYATPLEGNTGQKQTRKIREKLREKYGILEE
jgi:Mn-dependent DtxR family transcriptional regulator